MEPNIWGPNTWKYLHFLSFNDSASYNTLSKFFYNLQYLLPCPTCRNNYQKHYNEFPFPKNKKNIPLWLIQFHNKVNKSLDKAIVNENEMLRYWKNKAKQFEYSKDIGLWIFIQCILHTHPGKRKIKLEIVEAHQFIWNHLDEILSANLKDTKEILKYFNIHPVNDVVTKYKYHDSIHDFFHKFNLISDIKKEQRICMDYCKVNR